MAGIPSVTMIYENPCQIIYLFILIVFISHPLAAIADESIMKVLDYETISQ